MYSSGSEDEEEELFGNGGRPAADEASEDSDGPQPSAYDQSYGSLGGDVLGEPDAPAQGSPRRRRRRAASGDDDRTPSRLFDFRRGADHWPACCELVEPRRGRDLAEAARREAESSAEKDADDFGFDDRDRDDLDDFFEGDDRPPAFGPEPPPRSGDDDPEDPNKPAAPPAPSTRAPGHATYRRLKDGSHALEIRPGHRVKLDLTALVSQGPDARDPRRGDGRGARRGDRRDAAGARGDAKGWRPARELVNDYTVTLDVFFEEPPPAGGLSLFQTALVHCEESRGGRRRARVSEGEALVNGAGGVGALGTFGDTAKARVEPGRWQRVVVSVRCGGGGGSGRAAGGVKKGEVRTYVQATPLALVRHERVAANERFSLRSDGLYLFSSRSEAMMPGGILLRTARVDLKAFDDGAVRRLRARDKVFSAVAEDDAAKVDAMRGKLALAELFAKPRPAWDAPAIVAAFGDAHVEGTSLEASSLLAWSHAVLDVALRRCLRQQAPFLAGLPRLAAQAAADAAHVFSRSAPLMKGLVRLLRNPGGPQLCAWLRAIKKKLADADVGESLLLPLLVEGRELLLVVERPSERTFTVVVVATAPTRALRHHAVDAADGRKVKFRSALVLANVPKKNALDDVFWAAAYNLAVHAHDGDTRRFYDVLLPFLTGKTLEASLVEAERDARDGGEPAGDGDDAFDARAAAAGRRGAWRSPQRSETAYVRCLFDALHYLMLRRGCRSRDAKQVRLALKAQLADFVARDLRVVAPDANGAKVARLVATQLAYGAAKFAARPDAPAGFRDGGPRAARAIAEGILSEVGDGARPRDGNVEVDLDLEASLATQWRDALAWRVEPCAPDAGNAATLRKYAAVDALAVPEVAATFEEALEALRTCDRLCSLVDNQPHAIKNDKLLILALVQHTLTCAVPTPRPRADASSPAAGRAAKRRRAKKEPEKVAPEAVPTDWAPGEAAEAAATAADCLWDGACDYATQVEALLTLRRLVEHFTAAVLSTQQDRALDLACLVVPGAACAIADAILRRRAADAPSSFCCQLRGQLACGRQLGHRGYGLSCETFATQTAAIEAHAPALAVCRSAVLDYFNSPDQRGLEKIMAFEDAFELRPGRPTVALLRNLCRELSLATPNPHLELCDALPCTSNVMKNYPEIAPYRDLNFFWKFFLNADRAAFSNYVPADDAPAAPERRGPGGGGRRKRGSRDARSVSRCDRLGAQLTWGWSAEEGGYAVSMGGASLRCRPDPDALDPVTGRKIPEDDAPRHRYPSRADPGAYLGPGLSAKQRRNITENDILYRPSLPGFQDSRADDAPALGQRDAELLLSYLTVPYIRLPLVLTFFASEDRVHKLASRPLRGLLDAVLFEPGRHLGLAATAVAPETVPTPRNELLATPHGHLLAELRRAPAAVLGNVVALLRGARALDTGAVCDAASDDFNGGVGIILYAARLGARVANFVAFLLAARDGTAAVANANATCLRGVPLRDLDVPGGVAAAALDAGAAQLRAQLAAFGRLLDEYLRTLDAQTRAAPGDEALVDRNSRLACDLHAHQLLLRRDATDDASVPGLLGSFLFLTTRHTFNKFRRDDGKILVPEFELYELLQHTRRRLCAAAAVADQAGLDAIMAPALATATSVTGAFVDGDGDAATDAAWGRVAGARNRGRYTTTARGDARGPVKSVADSSELDVEIDAQIGQLTLRGKHLAALESAVAGYRDVRVVFGDAAIQASLSERAEHRNVYRLVGLDHSIEWWPTPHGDCPSIPETYGREYDPSELFESELWIPRVFEPLRRAFFDGPRPAPMQFLLPDDPFPASAEVAELLGLHQRLGGPAKRVVLFKRRRCAHVYELCTRGREWHWSLHLATDARFCLAALQPSSGRRVAPFPPWWTHGGGAAYPVGVLDHVPSELDGDGRHESVVIRRDATHADNLSGGVETYTPPRLLRGLIPETLLDDFRFWRDESDPAAFGREVFRGYALDDGGDDDDDDAGSKEASDDLIVVELVDHGGCKALTCTGLVGRSARVARVSKAAAKRRRAAVDALAALVADLGVLRVAAQSAEPRKRRDKAPPKKPGKVEELAFREGADVEWRSAAAAADEADKWLPCEVVRVDYGKRTYDLEFSGPYQYLGTQRGVKPEDVNARGANSEAKAEGEGQWRFSGLSDSEDDDWASDGHESDGDGDGGEPAGAGRSLPFDVRARLGAALDAAGRDENACADAVRALAAAGRTFDTVGALVDAVAAHCGAAPAADDGELRLLDLLHAPRKSRLFTLAGTLARVECLSHVLAWTRATGGDDDVIAAGVPELSLVELPRLKLSFAARRDHAGKLRLFSVDHVDLFVVPDQRAAAAFPLLEGIDHALLLSNARGDSFALVPVVIPRRPPVRTQPFSVELVLDREGTYNGAYDGREPFPSTRFFLYAVHVSMAFLMPRGLPSALYLLLLRLLKRDYAGAFRLCDSVASDVALGVDEAAIFTALGEANDDRAPGAHAVRLKVSLVTAESGEELPWDLTTELSRYVSKLPHVGACCRLALRDELRLLESPKCAVDEDSAAYSPADRGHEPHMLALCHNRRSFLRALAAGEATCAVATPPRERTSDGWPLYADETCFGMSYAEAADARSVDDLARASRRLPARDAREKDAAPADGAAPPAPPGGWLVVAAFTASWSSACASLVPAAEALAPAYPAAVFASCRVDADPGLHELAVARGVAHFPSFVLSRGDKKLAVVAASKSDEARTIPALVAAIERELTDDDTHAYAAWRHHAASSRSDAPPADDGDDGGDVLWTWDLEAAGDGLRVEALGATAVLPSRDDLDDLDDARACWEWAKDDGKAEWRAKWAPFEPQTQTFLEIAFLSGKLYREQSVTDEGDNGLHVYFSDDDIDIDTYVVSGFKGYRTSDYEDIRLRRKGYRAMVLGEEAYLSKRQEAIDRRNAEWRDQYEAYSAKRREARRGRDAVAVRGTAPLQRDSGVHTWRLRWTHAPGAGGRGDGCGVVAEGSEAFGPALYPCLGGPDCDGGSLGLHASGELWVAGAEAARVGAAGLLWSEGDEVACVLDTSNGGSLSFSVNGVPVSRVVEDVFETLGCTECYPAVSLAPLDDDGGRAAAKDAALGLAASKGAEKKEDEENEENDGDDDDEDAADEIMSKEPWEQLQILELAQLTRVAPEKIVKLNAKQRAELERVARPPVATVTIVDGAPDPPPATPERPRKARAASDASEAPSEDDDDDGDDASAAKKKARAGKKADAEDDDVPLHKVRWMRETPNGWVAHDAKVSAALERAKRLGKLETSLHVGGESFTFKLAAGGGDGGGGDEPLQIPDGGGEASKLRRHFVGEGLRGQWELLSVKYTPPASLYGASVLGVIEKVWSGDESFAGAKYGFGFLLLYALFQGDLKAHVCGSSWSTGGLWGSLGWGSVGSDRPRDGAAFAPFPGKKAKQTNDSHRLALLLTQLYSDRRVKSVWGSLVNVLGRNKQLCVRLPRFRDSRRKRRSNVFNGWVDDAEPKSPLGELFEQVVPVMQKLRKRRGALLFPPKPPHDALPAPRRSRPVEKDADACALPELSDAGRSSFEASGVTETQILELAKRAGFDLALPEDRAADGRPRAPVHCDDGDGWRAWADRETRLAEARQYDKVLLVAYFRASWCAACRSSDAVVKALALSAPTARFATLDFDDCDDVAAAVGVVGTPCCVFFRGGGTKAHAKLDCTAAPRGDGDDFAASLVKGLMDASTPDEKLKLSTAFNKALETAGARASEREQLRALREAAGGEESTYSVEAAKKAAARLAASPAALATLTLEPTRDLREAHVVRRERASRRGRDLAAPFAVVAAHDAARTPVAAAFLERMRSDAADLAAARGGWEPALAALPADAAALFDGDGGALRDARAGLAKLAADVDAARRGDSVAVALAVPLLTRAANDVSGGDPAATCAFVLARLAGSAAELWPEFVFGALLSSRGEADVRKLNPFLDGASIETLLELVAATMLRANRVGVLSRVAGDCAALEEKLAAAAAAEDRGAAAAVLGPQIRQIAKSLASTLSSTRAYARATAKGVGLDPRFLVFEFVWNLFLRPKQVEIVEKLRSDALAGRSTVKQMIMGAGKTTVVAPLLALMLADGESLVVSVVPKALLEMTRARLRATFATIIAKRVFTLHYDRSTVPSPQLLASLVAARDARAVVVATPTSVKSIMLGFVEALRRARDGAGPAPGVDELRGVLELFRGGAMLLDEVDLLLHPLKSELNFPVGERRPLDGADAGERWSLPMALVDAVFYASHRRSYALEARGEVLEALERLRAAVDGGYDRMAFQRLPHLTLLDPAYYHAHVKPPLAAVAFAWLQGSQHLAGISRADALDYLLRGAVAASDVDARRRLLEEAADADGSSPELAAALGAARSYGELYAAVRAIEREADATTFAAQRELAALDGRLAAARRRLADAEDPPDASLDNSVVVWLAPAFAAGRAGAGAALDFDRDGAADGDAAGAVAATCVKLEESLGVAVKRCDDRHEALARCRDLARQKRLRCVVCGGGERRPVCGPSCNRSHVKDGACVRCGNGWGYHNGHMCQNGARGAWPLRPKGRSRGDDDDDDDAARASSKVDGEALLRDLVGGGEGAAAPVVAPSRCLVFVGHGAQPEAARARLWGLGVASTDATDGVCDWVEARPPWPAPEAAPAGDDEPAALKRATSTEVATARLEGLRAIVDGLERRRAAAVDADDAARRALRARAADAHDRLKRAVAARLARLRSFGAVAGGGADDAPPDPAGGVACARALDALTRGGALDGGARAALAGEARFLERLRLASATTALVASPHQKKLLNLAADWLGTFMPHCLAKVNRVSYGLLEEREIARALRDDPRVPRSRLKLAVPFVGKDVPTTASEFAHPDVTIGLTILAYRYSGLRREDFDEIADALTADFGREIGPARDRPSSRRHELWVLSAGGSIRGLGRGAGDDDSKTVVQLKFLQRSNADQMDRLYGLWRREPHAIHHFLGASVMPTHMRTQRLKISASGQAVGGDMLFPRRVGFSGTPSDLLPLELGKCGYEKGDDAAMLDVVLDPEVTDITHLDVGWSVANVLDLAAAATEPRVHALIDTGALVTGLRNLEVARQLLKRGLPWCDGVVYLDHDDKKQVLVRATGRSMPEEQCGVPLERRFAFYDMVHTTGMDIRHVANATALVTLGKDMVWRDYAQGVYRMRGVGNGQRVRVVLIPEVRRLLRLELAGCEAAPETGSDLERVVAWLVVNALKSEQLQWSMLCAQNLKNVYRKAAFKALLDEETPAAGALDVFEEAIDVSLEASVPDPAPFAAKLKMLVDRHAAFCASESDRATAARVLADVAAHAVERKSRGGKRLDTEQEREQEQEQEKEIRAARDQRVEVEKFVEREYSRDAEAASPWPLAALAAFEPGADDDDAPFFPLAELALRHHEPLAFPGQLLASRNYFRRSWGGLRRLRNVVVVMEWAPRGGGNGAPPPPPADGAAVLTARQATAVAKAHALFRGGDAAMSRDALRDAVETVEDVDEPCGEAKLDGVLAEFGTPGGLLDEAGFARLLASGGLHPRTDGRYYVLLSLSEAETLRRALHARGDAPLATRADGATPDVALRYSPLAGGDAPRVDGSAPERPGGPGDGGVLLDASPAWWARASAVEGRCSLSPTGATRSEAAVAHACLRFFDGDVHFGEASLHALVRALAAVPPRRRRIYFAALAAARRRFDRDPGRTPLGRAFELEDGFALLGRRATARFLRRAIAERGLGPWRAFLAFDSSNTGRLAPPEVFGALRFLGAGADVVDAEDVLDFVGHYADGDAAIDAARAAAGGDGGAGDRLELSYRAYARALRVDADADDAEAGGDDALAVAPHGADELRAAELQRRRLAIEAAAAERARSAARAEALDARVFDEELLEAERRHGAAGVNPAVADAGDGATRTVFDFGRGRLPLRCAALGPSSPRGGPASPRRRGGEGLDLVRLDFSRVAARPVPELLCACGHALSVYESSWERCGRCRPRDDRGTTRICWECYVNVCERCVRGHRRAELAKRADTSGRATFARCATGAGVALHVPAKALRFAHPRPLERYTLTLDVRLDRLPAPRAHAALVCLNPAGPRRRASLYVDGDGALAAPRDVEGDGAARPPAAARLRPGKWHAVSLVVDAAAGTLEAFVDGAAAASIAGGDAAELALGRSLHLFAGGARAHARGGGVRRVVLLSTALDAAAVADVAAKSAAENPEFVACATLVQKVARGFRVRREAEKEEDDDEEEEDDDDEEEEDEPRRARRKKKS